MRRLETELTQADLSYKRLASQYAELSEKTAAAAALAEEVQGLHAVQAENANLTARVQKYEATNLDELERSLASTTADLAAERRALAAEQKGRAGEQAAATNAAVGIFASRASTCGVARAHPSPPFA